MIDDEDRLIAMLQVFARVRRKQVEVFFDQAPPTRGGKKMVGMVSVHQVPTGKTADQAIIDRLRQQAKNARMYTVVSSDRQVRSEARDLKARLVSSEEFALELQAARQEAQTAQKENPTLEGPDEIDEWLKLFGKR